LGKEERLLNVGRGKETSSIHMVTKKTLPQGGMGIGYMLSGIVLREEQKEK